MHTRTQKVKIAFTRALENRLEIKEMLMDVVKILIKCRKVSASEG